MSIIAAYAVPHPPLIIPEIGGADSRQIAKTVESYRLIANEIAAFKPSLIIIASPHSTIYGDYFHVSPGSGADGDFEQFRAPQLKIHADYDESFVQHLSSLASKHSIPAGTLGQRTRALDHATMIPLHFIQQEYTDFKAVRISPSGLSALAHYRLGQCIKQAAEELGRKTVFIASGDLSHKLKTDGPYGFSPDGPEYDRMIQKVFASGDFLTLLEQSEGFCESAAECGQKPFEIMAGALDRTTVKAALLSYEGPFGVGYGVGSFITTGADDSRCYGDILESKNKSRIETIMAKEDAFTKLARLAVETYARTGKRISLTSETLGKLPPELTQRRAGVFVSIHKDGSLRGCIGTISACESSIAEEIISNAISACSRDFRFEPIQERELPWLVYSVDVLGPSEPIPDKTFLDPKRYGVIVANGDRRGLLLPDLEGVDSVEQQIDIARRKAGIAPSETIRLHRFEVVRHG